MRQHGNVPAAVEHHVLVDLVGQHHDVPVTDQLRQRVEVSAGGRGAGGIVRAVEQHQARTRIHRRAHALPVIAKTGLRERQPHAASAREPHGGLVGIVGGIEGDGFIPGTDDGLNRRKDRLGRTECDRDFALRVGAQAINRQELGGDALAQRQQALHGGVLVVAGGHGRGHEFGEPWIDGVVGKALPEVQSVQLASTARHDAENRRADLRQLARHATASVRLPPPPAPLRPRPPGPQSAPRAAARASAAGARTLRSARSLRRRG